MNRELRALLAEAGFPRALQADAWKSAIVMRNAGSVPVSPRLPPDTFLRNFTLLLLDGTGRIAHLARCAAASDPVFARETAILEALSARPTHARTVPHTRSACSERLRLQLVDYIPGRSYAELVRTGGADGWSQAACEILEASEALGRSAAEALPELLEAGDTVDLAQEAAPKLRSVGDAGFPASFLDALHSALRPVPPLPRRLQHGDLWPGNVLRHRGSWWIIDFAEFGHARVPMYDAFHMIHKTWLMLDLDARADDWKRASQRVLDVSAGRLALSPQQVRAAMLYYLIHLTSYRLRHGAEFQDRASFMNRLLDAAETLRAGTPLEALAYPWER